eukprot:1847147-Amphidinium_carterae.1
MRSLMYFATVAASGCGKHITKGLSRLVRSATPPVSRVRFSCLCTIGYVLRVFPLHFADFYAHTKQFMCDLTVASKGSFQKCTGTFHRCSA